MLQEESQHKEEIATKIEALNEKTPSLAKAIAAWKSRLEDDHSFQQFNWKADVVETWIGTIREGQGLWVWETLIIPLIEWTLGLYPLP